MDAILSPIKGEELIKYLGSREYPNLLFPDKVADTIESALKRIKLFFETKPTVDGNNIWGILQIRRELFIIAEGYPLVNAFIITAPHTHWDTNRPVVYKFDSTNSKYIIGAHKIENSEIYKPVSFVFSQKTLLPYEWADSSVSINIIELKKCIQILSKLNKKIFPFNFPLGVSIDFRFKSSLSDNLCSTVEFPADDESIDFSYIIKRDLVKQIEDSSPFDQVGWHPVSDESLNLNYDENRILNILRKHINSAEDLNDLL